MVRTMKFQKVFLRRSRSGAVQWDNLADEGSRMLDYVMMVSSCHTDADAANLKLSSVVLGQKGRDHDAGARKDWKC